VQDHCAESNDDRAMNDSPNANDIAKSPDAVEKVVAHDALLKIWFREGEPDCAARVSRRVAWWFDGAAVQAIEARLPKLFEAALGGQLDSWLAAPRSRLALILLLDRVSRRRFRGTSRAFQQDATAQAIVLDGLANGHYRALATAWHRIFFLLPLGHAEDIRLVARSIGLAEALVPAVPAESRWWFNLAVARLRRNQDLLARFGRYPHRNDVLARATTRQEREHFIAEQSSELAADAIPAGRRPVSIQTA
jgi:uncharacterized protein (DUF924 family)